MATSLPSEYLDELNILNREIREKQPSDVLQFCANYFNSRLQQQKQQNQHESQDPLASSGTSAAAAGFARFNTHSFTNGDPHDPHSAHEDPKSGGGSNVPSQVSATASLPSQNSSQDPIGAGNKLHLHENASSNFPMNFNANRRTSVSAESITPSQLSDAVAKVNPNSQLSPEQLERLNQSVAKNFLFSNLDEEALHSVLHSLQEKKVPEGSTIIQQGDEGDFFYIVESGTVEFHRDGEKVATSGAGSSFGELALMYNAPRAASVTAVSDCVLWALDRVTFRRILLHKTANKRAMYEEFLREVPVLKVLSRYELSKLADALNTEVYEPGQVVVKEGDVGEEFFIVESGAATVTKAESGDKVIMDLSKGDYFGEVALLNDKPRQATVTASTKLKVVALGKSAFQRLLGEVVDILKRQDPTQAVAH